MGYTCALLRASRMGDLLDPPFRTPPGTPPKGPKYPLPGAPQKEGRIRGPQDPPAIFVTSVTKIAEIFTNPPSVHNPPQMAKSPSKAPPRAVSSHFTKTRKTTGFPVGDKAEGKGGSRSETECHPDLCTDVRRPERSGVGRNVASECGAGGRGGRSRSAGADCRLGSGRWA